MCIDIEILSEDIQQYEYSQNFYFPHRDPQPGSLSWDRKNLTDLSVNKFIYIHDNYKKLKEEVT